MRWQHVRAIAVRQALVLWRSPHRLFDVTVWPVVDTLLFGSLAVFFAREGGSGGKQGAAYLIAGVLLWHVVYQSQIALATGFLEETWSRNLLSLMCTPLTETEYVAGVALFGLVKLVMGVGAVAVMVSLLYAFNVTSLGWALLPIVAVLLAAGWAVALFVVGMVLRFGTGAEALAWGILFVVMPLSGVFYPVSALPAAIRPVSALLPTTHAFAAARAVLDGEAMPWRQLGVAGLTTLLLLVAAVAFVRAMLGTFRKRGFITRYS
ncbi:MAG: type transport system permease protein [Frankiaceae bacterium]|jgi:ABC-2 type transport system permease protein|nr:type transport system permease protein [Frankiaceae bacterium]